jgi:hypothetical protein
LTRIQNHSTGQRSLVLERIPERADTDRLLAADNSAAFDTSQLETPGILPKTLFLSCSPFLI